VHTFGGEIPRVPGAAIKNTCLIVCRLLSLQFWLFTASVPRMKCCGCCSQGIRKIYLPAHCVANCGGLLKVSPAEQPLGRVGLLWAKCELGMKIVLLLIPGSERNRHQLIQSRVLLPNTVSS